MSSGLDPITPGVSAPGGGSPGVGSPGVGPPGTPGVGVPAQRARAGVLDRSGIDPGRLFTDGDSLAVRTGTPAGELSARLEAARAALVSNRATDALALLDEGWGGARHTEEGWYLRGGSLAALGLPGESLRVTGEALQQMPASLALRYLSALARTFTGDTPGARQLMQELLAEAPDEGILIAQYAVVLARAGRNEEATEVLTQLMARQPDHPAVAYAQAWLASERTARSRRGEHAPATGAPKSPDSSVFPDSSTPGDSSVRTCPTGSPAAGTSAGSTEPGNPVESLMHRLSALLREVGGSTEEIGVPGDRSPPTESSGTLYEVRLMLRAISTGGALAAAGTPRQLHAARAVLGAALSVLSGETARGGTEGGTPDDALRDIVTLVKDQRTEEARQLLLRSEHVLPASIRSLLRAILGDGEPRRTARSVSPRSGRLQDGEVLTDRAHHDAYRGVIGPVRLGLSLVRSPSNTRATGALSAEIGGGDPHPADQVGEAPSVEAASVVYSLADEASRGEWHPGSSSSRGGLLPGSLLSYGELYSPSSASRGTPLRLAAMVIPENNGTGIADPTRSVGWDVVPDLIGRKDSTQRTGDNTDRWMQILAVAVAGLATIAMITRHTVSAFALFGGIGWLALRRWSKGE